VSGALRGIVALALIVNLIAGQIGALAFRFTLHPDLTRTGAIIDLISALILAVPTSIAIWRGLQHV
jgi:hypothetical protein